MKTSNNSHFSRKIYVLLVLLLASVMLVCGCATEKPDTPDRTGAPETTATAAPTEAPTDAPKVTPTEAPANIPTDEPTAAPTDAATATPTEAPTNTPSPAPTPSPTSTPAPTPEPTHTPTPAPTDDPITPVLIIPGILGSEIENDGVTVWPIIDTTLDFTNMTAQEQSSILITAFTNVSMLTLNEDMTENVPLDAVAYTPVTKALDKGRNIGTLDTYRALAAAVAKEIGSENVFFFGYDFRMDIRDTADKLNTLIENIKADKNVSKVNIVAHSMGGLVLTSYAKKYGTGSLKHGVLCGSPLLGSENASLVLQDTDVLLQQLGQGETLPEEFLEFKENEMVKEAISSIVLCARSMPSVYAMIPDESFDPSKFTSPAAIKGRETADYIRKDVVETLDKTCFSFIIGTGMDTLAPGGVTNASGDGVVTYESASANSKLSSRAYTYSNIAHRDLVSNEECLKDIVSIVT